MGMEGRGVEYGKRIVAEPIAPGACMEYPLLSHRKRRNGAGEWEMRSPEIKLKCA
jgi:hypothetical protein